MKFSNNYNWHNVFVCEKCGEVLASWEIDYARNRRRRWLFDSNGDYTWDSCGYRSEFIFDNSSYHCSSCGEEKPKLIKKIARAKAHWLSLILDGEFEFKKEKKLIPENPQNNPGALTLSLKNQFSDVIFYLEVNGYDKLVKELKKIKDELNE